MRKEIVTIDAAATVLEVSRLMEEKDTGYIVVMEKINPIGIVTERNLVLKVMAKEKAPPPNIKVSTIMSTPITTVDLEASVEYAAKLMVKHRIRKLLVTKDNVVYGVFTTRDLAKHFDYIDRIAKDIINVQSIYDTHPSVDLR